MKQEGKTAGQTTPGLESLSTEARDVYFNMRRTLRARESYIAALERKTKELETKNAAHEKHVADLLGHINAVDELYGLQVPMSKIITRHLAHRWFPLHSLRGQRLRRAARLLFKLVGFKWDA